MKSDTLSSFTIAVVNDRASLNSYVWAVLACWCISLLLLVKTIVGGSVGLAQIFQYHSFPCFVWALNTACVLFQSTSNLKVAFDWGHIQIQIFENISWNQRTHMECLKVLYVSGIVVCAQLNGFRIFFETFKVHCLHHFQWECYLCQDTQVSLFSRAGRTIKQKAVLETFSRPPSQLEALSLQKAS